MCKREGKCWMGSARRKLREGARVRSSYSRWRLDSTLPPEDDAGVVFIGPTRMLKCKKVNFNGQGRVTQGNHRDRGLGGNMHGRYERDGVLEEGWQLGGVGAQRASVVGDGETATARDGQRGRRPAWETAGDRETATARRELELGCLVEKVSLLPSCGAANAKATTLSVSLPLLPASGAGS